MTTVQKSISFLVLYVAICLMTASTLKLPDFECDEKGNVKLTSDEDLNKTEIVEANGNLCTPPSKTLSSGCGHTGSKSVKIVYSPTVKDGKDVQIVGGKNSTYGILSCKEGPFKAFATAAHFVVSTPLSVPTKVIPIQYAISLSITGQTTGLLGEHITLSLEGPDTTHFLQPIECTAKATGPLDKDKLKIWELHNGGLIYLFV